MSVLLAVFPTCGLFVLCAVRVLCALGGPILMLVAFLTSLLQGMAPMPLMVWAQQAPGTLLTLALLQVSEPAPPARALRLALSSAIGLTLGALGALEPRRKKR